MRNLSQLNPSKITDNGYYFDIENGNMFSLTDEEIIELRKMYRELAIAPNREIAPRKEISRNQNYKLASHQKYNDGRHRARKNRNSLKTGIIKFVVVGGITLAVTIGGINTLIQNYNADDLLEESVSYYQVETKKSSNPLVQSSNGIILQEQNMKEEIRAELIELYCEQFGADFQSIYNQIVMVTNNFTSMEYKNGTVMINSTPITGQNEAELLSNMVSEISKMSLELVSEEDSIQKKIVKKYCDIYQVDFDTIYNRLVELTNNFTSENYLNGYIPNVTCKGEVVIAQSEEELILYFVRCAKQLPANLGINANNLYVQTGYQSPTDYGKEIGYYSKLLGVDPFLVYSITQAETGWDSPLFLNSNNPAGLRINGSWWNFSTKEEGFIELALEILKYNRKGAFTIEEIGSIHAPLEDDPSNKDWIPNVTMIYNDVSTNHSELVEIVDAGSYQR